MTETGNCTERVVVKYLTTSASLRAVDPVWLLDGETYCNLQGFGDLLQTDTTVEVIFRFQISQDQMILAAADMDGAVDCVGPLERLARLTCEGAMDL